jgi:predicted Zn-ribbon and HTH transcriptional regulator
MACMEHECEQCGLVDFDNITWTKCPNCGSEKISNIYDEAFIDSDNDIL